MTRLRWSLVGVIAAIAVVAIVQSLFTYARHDLTVGVLAVVALTATLVVGLASLAQARRRIGRELEGLRAQSPRGELYGALLQRLESLRAAGIAPNPDALAESSAAEEAGRAYLGRYLVATTVLIGLVGTFAGLMATLGKVAPLLTEGGGGGLSLLAAPLEGLHVTFGASLVAILVTLALALAQGDLAVHEELALARLRDITIHDAIPRLWPAPEDGAARTVRAIDDLKTSFGEALARSLERTLEQALEKSTTRLAAQTRGESERSAKALESAASTVEKQVTRLCESITGSLNEAGRKQAATLLESAQATAAALGKTATTQAQQLEELRARVQSGLDRAADEHGKVLGATTTALLQEIGGVATRVLDGLRAELLSTTSNANDATQAAVRETVAASQNAIAEALRAAAGATTASAQAAQDAAAASAKAAQEAAAAGSAAVAQAAAASAESSRVSTQAAQDAGAAAATAVRSAAEAIQTAGTASATALEAAARSSSKASEDAVAASAKAGELFTRASAEAAQTAANQTSAATEAAAARLVSAGQEAIAGLAAQLTTTVEPLFATSAARLETLHEMLFELAGRLEGVGGNLAQTTATVQAQGAQQVSALEETGKNVLAAFDRAVLGGGAALDGAAKALSEAARDLRTGTEGIAPTLRSLGSELGSLGREVALMAARGQEGESQMVIFGELERLGAGVDRLSALVELARGGPAATDVATAAAETAAAPTPETAAPPPPDDGDATPAATTTPATTATNPRGKRKGRGAGKPASLETKAAIESQDLESEAAAIASDDASAIDATAPNETDEDGDGDAETDPDGAVRARHHQAEEDAIVGADARAPGDDSDRSDRATADEDSQV